MKINCSIIQILALFPIICIVTTSCKDSKGKSSDENNELVYEASILAKKDVSNQLSLPGELEGYYETGIIAKVNGYVKQILVDIGDQVSQGQLLVELEAPELMSQLEGAYSEQQVKEAVYLNSKGKYGRLKQTNKTAGAVSPYDMDFTKTTIVADSLSFIASVAKYQSIKNLTNYLNITAPFEGIITDRALAPGALVGPNDKNLVPILKLKNESKLRLHIAVPEKHIAEIKKGDLVRFTVNSYPDKSFEGKITRISKTLNTQTRSEIIEIVIDNKSGVLIPGMYAQASLPIQRLEPSFVVPQSAVATTMERSFVIKVTHGTTPVWVDVQKGELQGEKVEVFGNLTAGDTLLNIASDEIRPSETIKIVVVNR